jgi:hypothetical protein
LLFFGNVNFVCFCCFLLLLLWSKPEAHVNSCSIYFIN